MTILTQIHERIAAIPEPCALAMRLTTTIGDMGLIEKISFVDGHAHITLCLTDPGCVHFTAMQSYIGDALSDLPEVQYVTVDQTLSEIWTPDRAS